MKIPGNSYNQIKEMSSIWDLLIIFWAPPKGLGPLSSSASAAHINCLLVSGWLDSSTTAVLGNYPIKLAFPKLLGSYPANGLHFHQYFSLGSLHGAKHQLSMTYLLISSKPVPPTWILHNQVQLSAQGTTLATSGTQILPRSFHHNNDKLFLIIVDSSTPVDQHQWSW